MAGRFDVTTRGRSPDRRGLRVLADGTNDPSSAHACSRSPRPPAADGPLGGVGTKIEITVFERQVWKESRRTDGYDLSTEGDGTRVTLHNVLEGHGFGKLITGFALRAARKGADDFGRSIKSAVEAS